MSGSEKPGSPSGNQPFQFRSYPDVPPPYVAVAAPANPPLGAGTSNAVFMTLPATRYDTMTSYVEDGSGTTTVVTMGTILDRPILVRCPFCKNTVTTETKAVSGLLAWLCCLGLMFVGCDFGCCLIPFCSKRLRDVEHYCPSCHRVVALYKRL